MSPWPNIGRLVRRVEANPTLTDGPATADALDNERQEAHCSRPMRSPGPSVRGGSVTIAAALLAR